MDVYKSYVVYRSIICHIKGNNSFINAWKQKFYIIINGNLHIGISIFIIQDILKDYRKEDNHSSVKGRVLDTAFIYFYLLIENTCYSLTRLQAYHMQENKQNLLNNVFLIFPNRIRD